MTFWLLCVRGARAAQIARKMSYPRKFRPGAVIPMPMSVTQDLRDAQVWRAHHWGLVREPSKTRKRLTEDGYALAASGGHGAPSALVQTLSAQNPDLRFCLVRRSADGCGLAAGRIWVGGSLHQLIEPPEQEKLLQQEFDLKPLELAF